MQPKPDPYLSRPALLLAWVLAIIGAWVCLWVAGAFSAQQLDRLDSLWPLPGLYLLEVALVGLAVVISLFLRNWNAALVIVPWLAGGILLAFVILGGFSIGPFLLPAMLAFWAVGVIADLGGRRKFAVHLELAMIAALLQGGLMLVVIGIIR